MSKKELLNANLAFKSFLRKYMEEHRTAINEEVENVWQFNSKFEVILFLQNNLYKISKE